MRGWDSTAEGMAWHAFLPNGLVSGCTAISSLSAAACRCCCDCFYLPACLPQVLKLAGLALLPPTVGTLTQLMELR